MKYQNESSEPSSIKKQIKKFENLGGAREFGYTPPSYSAYNIAYNVADIIEKVFLSNNMNLEFRVSPDVEGGLAIYIFGINSTSGILISNDVEICMYLKNIYKEDANFIEIENTNEAILHCINEIYKFMKEDVLELAN